MAKRMYGRSNWSVLLWCVQIAFDGLSDVVDTTTVYPGIAATAGFLLNKGNPAYSSFFQIGWAYAIGIAFAIITCAPTSGGHFNPGKTMCRLYYAQSITS